MLKKSHWAVLTAAAGTVMLVGAGMAHADINSTTGFGTDTTPSSYPSSNSTVTLNGQGSESTALSSGATPTVSGNGSTLTLTSDASYSSTSAEENSTHNDWYEATSAWFNTAQTLSGAWTASFDYTSQSPVSTSSNASDNWFFVVQNTTKGLNLLGDNGDAGGYFPDNDAPGTSTSNIPVLHSLGIGNGAQGTVSTTSYGPSSSIQMGYNGGGTNTLADTTVSANTGAVNMTPSTSAPKTTAVTISYNGATSLTITLTQGTNTFSDTYTLPESLESILGSSTGYVGFTGSTDYGSLITQQQISNFTFTTVPEPAPVALIGLGGLGLLMLRKRRKNMA